MRKQTVAAPIKIKDLGDDGRIEGYGSVFGVEDTYGEIVDKGAFTKSLAASRQRGRMPLLLWQHDTHRPIGVWEEMREDDYGLFAKGRLLKDDVAAAAEAYALLKAGALDGLSIGFRTIVDQYNRETEVVHLVEVDLLELSIVSLAANDLARITSVKAEDVQTKRDLERALRDAGFSRTEATAITSRFAEKAPAAPQGDPAAATDADPLAALLKDFQAARLDTLLV